MKDVFARNKVLTSEGFLRTFRWFDSDEIKAANNLKDLIVIFYIKSVRKKANKDDVVALK